MSMLIITFGVVSYVTLMAAKKFIIEKDNSLEVNYNEWVKNNDDSLVNVKQSACVGELIKIVAVTFNKYQEHVRVK